jgi:hypothetical protein
LEILEAGLYVSERIPKSVKNSLTLRDEIPRFFPRRFHRLHPSRC